MKDREMTVVQHLEELRRRLIVAILALAVATAASFTFAGKVLEFLLRPAGDISLAVLAMGEAFFVKLKIAFIVGFFLSLPVILHQGVAFILPALDDRERRYLLGLLPASVFLFFGGVVFAYYAVLPFVTRFFLSFTSETLRPVISAGAYVSFVVSVIVPFGLVFQLPVAVMLLTRLGVLTPHFLVRNRKFAVLVIFVMAAFLTPPDIVSQIFIAIPMLALYEISVLISRLSYRPSGD